MSDLAVCRLCKGEAHRLGGLVFHTEWLNGCPLRSSEGFTPDQWQTLHGESVEGGTETHFVKFHPDRYDATAFSVHESRTGKSVAIALNIQEAREVYRDFMTAAKRREGV